MIASHPAGIRPAGATSHLYTAATGHRLNTHSQEMSSRSKSPLPSAGPALCLQPVLQTPVFAFFFVHFSAWTPVFGVEHKMNSTLHILMQTLHMCYHKLTPPGVTRGVRVERYNIACNLMFKTPALSKLPKRYSNSKKSRSDRSKRLTVNICPSLQTKTCLQQSLGHFLSQEPVLDAGFCQLWHNAGFIKPWQRPGPRHPGAPEFL